jgi:hypothetical protein
LVLLFFRSATVIATGAMIVGKTGRHTGTGAKQAKRIASTTAAAAEPDATGTGTIEGRGWMAITVVIGATTTIGTAIMIGTATDTE